MKHGENMVKIKQLYKSTFSISKARWLVKLLCLVELFLGGIVSQQLKYLWQIYPYTCMYAYLICTAIICYFSALLSSLGLQVLLKGCQRRGWFLGVKMPSRDSAAMRGTSVRPFVRLCPQGSPVPAQLSLSWGCSASSAASPLVNPDWRVFLSLCVTNTIYPKLYSVWSVLRAPISCGAAVPGDAGMGSDVLGQRQGQRAEHIPATPCLVVPLVPGWHLI